MRARGDYAMLALLFGCGFRTSELVGLEWMKSRWVTATGQWMDLIGKLGRIRTVLTPIRSKRIPINEIRAAGGRE